MWIKIVRNKIMMWVIYFFLGFLFGFMTNAIWKALLGED